MYCLVENHNLFTAFSSVVLPTMTMYVFVGISRVARWYLFEPKIPIWVNFVGPWNRKGWYILLLFRIYYGRVVYFW
jgi:hypothetical protein